MNIEIFKKYDIRGIYDKTLTEKDAYLIGKAFVRLYNIKLRKLPTLLTVGHDARLSCEPLKNALIKGILECGVDVVDLGLVPTPVQYFSLFTLDVDGGIMITASHNPPEYNGFKLSIGKETIFDEDIQKIRYIIEKKDFISSAKKGKVNNYDIKKRLC